MLGWHRALEQPPLARAGRAARGVVAAVGPQRLDDAAALAPVAPHVVDVEHAAAGQVLDHLVARGRSRRPGAGRDLPGHEDAPRSCGSDPVHRDRPVGRQQELRVVGDHDSALRPSSRSRTASDRARRPQSAWSSPVVGSSRTTTGVSRSSVRAISNPPPLASRERPPALARHGSRSRPAAPDELVGARRARPPPRSARGSRPGGRRRCSRTTRRRAASPGPGCPTLARSDASVRSRRSCPSSRTAPASGSAKRSSRRASRRLAGTAGAHERHDLARVRSRRPRRRSAGCDATRDRVVTSSSSIAPCERGRKRRASGGRPRSARLVEQLEHALAPADGGEQRGGEMAQVGHRSQQLGQVGEEGDQTADRQPSALD